MHAHILEESKSSLSNGHCARTNAALGLCVGGVMRPKPEPPKSPNPNCEVWGFDTSEPMEQLHEPECV